MSIKNTLLFVCNIALLASAALTSLKAEQPDLSEPIHLGTSRFYSPYKIPTPGMLPSYPVTAAEYCTFLQTYASDESCLLYSDYYDSSFIATSQDYFSLAAACIQRAGVSPNYHYSITKDYSILQTDSQGNPEKMRVHPGTDIIDGLRFENVRAQFMAQRQLPSVKDVCDYLNDKIQGDAAAAAAAIQANYHGSHLVSGYTITPGKAPYIFNSSIASLFEHADQIAACVISNTSSYVALKAVPEPWSFGADVMQDVASEGPQSQITFQWNGTFYQAVCDATLEYRRPCQWTQIDEVSLNAQ